MKFYAGIDLHSNNCVVVIIDEEGKLIYQKRLENNLTIIEQALNNYKSNMVGIVIESTFNWYWLVDGLMDHGYQVHLANTTAIQQYSGMKHTNDFTDAMWLAELLRLGLLPEGYIYPKEERALRDLLRKRGQLVQQRTQNILTLQTSIYRNTGTKISGNKIASSMTEEIIELFKDKNVQFAAACNLKIIQLLNEEIKRLEKIIIKQAKHKSAFKNLKSVPGIGDILSLTILLETGDIKRFDNVGNFSSYCRCVDSKKVSNGKKKGENNRKNGNKYLSWAFIEAANFAIRYNEKIKKYYQRKLSKTKQVIAIKTIAHKIARACYYIMRNDVKFEIDKAFA
jgi:transposase